MIRVIALLMLASSALAGEAEDLAKLTFQEAGGESVRSAALTACAAVNRARHEHTTIRGLVRKGIAKWKPVPRALQPYFISIAKTAISARNGGICNGANAWNHGRRPYSNGIVKHYSGKQTYYTLAEG
jgi:hypothetical protein